jgi:hypothetical protein
MLAIPNSFLELDYLETCIIKLQKRQFSMKISIKRGRPRHCLGLPLFKPRGELGCEREGH